MGLKKYEIITVGSDKRVRALRSWQVQDRYVNIGDVGGIVYDEKTLSQDGACWLFRGNFNFPGARIGGDSIVDVGEEAPDVNSPAPDLNILGSSAVVGSKVRFSSMRTGADAITLTAADFEQGGIVYSKGTNWETWKTTSTYSLRPKTPIFMGGMATTLKLDVPGYKVQAFVTDRDGIGTVATAEVSTGEGVTLTVPAGQYFTMKLIKNPLGVIVPADATAAQIKFTGDYKNTLNIVDSRVSINPVTDTANRVSVILGGNYLYTTGGEFPPCNIVGSTVNLTRDAATSRSIYIVADVENSNVSVNATSGNAVFIGVYSNVKNLVYNLPSASMSVAGKNSIQAYNCDNMVVNTTNFPGLAAMQTAGVPIKFYSCNLIEGRFYHHAQIANTYRDINFDLATKDLGKLNAAGHFLISSEVNGMYRLTNGTIITALVESHESVKSIGSSMTEAYNTTIYADAYLNGRFDLKGTNVFGNSMKHDASNTQNVLAVQGNYTATSVGGKITGFTSNPLYVCIPTPLRINGSKGLSIRNLPAGYMALMFMTDANGVITRLQSTTVTNTDLAANALVDCKVFIRFSKTAEGTPITPDDVKGVTVTTYNGCKIVNTKETAATIAGNVRVEDNATLIDVSVTGTGYFGGNSIIQAPSYFGIQLPIEGAAYMSGNAVFAPSVVNETAGLSLLEMTDNAVFAGRINTASASYDIMMANNAQFFGHLNSPSGFIMRGNSFASAESVVLLAGTGSLIMRDDARVENGSLMAKGHITLCGKYKQTANKVWTGKRVIGSQDAPLYDDNVKTQYDF